MYVCNVKGKITVLCVLIFRFWITNRKIRRPELTTIKDLAKYFINFLYNMH